jgi:hypothetical protein
MKEFIDHVIRHALAEGFLGHGPLPLADDACSEPPQDIDDPVIRANIHAMAEHLSTLAERRPPEWSQGPEGFLDDPVFGGGSHARPFMLGETPAAFRRRLLFAGPVLGKLWATLRKKV